MRQMEVIEQIDAILGHLPTEQQIHVALRYAGIDEIIQKISAVREKLEPLDRFLFNRE